MKGLGLTDLPVGVKQSADDRGVIAYEIGGKAIVVRPLSLVLEQGYSPVVGYQTNTSWPGNYSISMRFRLWGERADILNIYRSPKEHLIGIMAASRHVSLRLNGGPAVEIAKWNMTDRKFHRLTLSFQGNTVTTRASGPACDDCGVPFTTELNYDEQAREIALDLSMVVLGRITKAKKVKV